MWPRRSYCIAVVAVLLTASSAFAQRGGFGGRGHGGFGFGARGFGGHNFGRGGFYSGHRGFVGGIGFGRGFAGRAHVRIGGFRAGFGGWYGRSPWSAGVWWPAVYSPIYSYVPPYPYYAYAPDYAYAPAAPNVTIITVPPSVVEPPPVRYQAPAPPSASAERPPRPAGSPVYLLAIKDGTVWAARAYWIEDSTIQLLTVRDERKSITADQVDRALTEQLNRDRGVEFRLP